MSIEQWREKVAAQQAKVKGAMMWCLDEKENLFACTPAVLKYMPYDTIGDLLASYDGEGNSPINMTDYTTARPLGDHAAFNQIVRETGEPVTYVDWWKPPGYHQWVKVLLTKTPTEMPGHILVVAADITASDSLARFLNHIDLKTQRLYLRRGRYIEFGDFLVLWYWQRGFTFKQIGALIVPPGATPKSRQQVERMQDNVRDALECSTTGEMRMVIAQSGLIHLLAVDFNPRDPATDYQTLYYRAAELDKIRQREAGELRTRLGDDSQVRATWPDGRPQQRPIIDDE